MVLAMWIPLLDVQIPTRLTASCPRLSHRSQSVQVRRCTQAGVVKGWRSDGHGVSSGEGALPYDAIFLWEMSRRQEDPCEPVTAEHKNICINMRISFTLLLLSANRSDPSDIQWNMCLH